jgi:TatD DNase family protein
MYIDTHAHVYLSEFDEDRSEVTERALKSNVKKILLPNIDRSTIDNVKACIQSNPSVYKGMMGLHPGSIKENYQDSLHTIKEELYNGSYIAVGEIGIDLYWDKTFIKEQTIAFRTQIEWALDLGLPIVVHARDSFYEIAEVLEAYRDTDLRGVFHCFSGDESILERALSFPTFLLGIGGVITFKNSGLDNIIKDAPLDRLVLETDSPYLAPVPNRGKRNEPSFIPKIALKLAEVKGMDFKTIERVTSKNAQQLFNLDVDE